MRLTRRSIIALQHQGCLSPVNDHANLSAVSIGPGGQVIALWTPQPDPELDGPATVVLGTGERRRIVPIPRVQAAWPMVQPMPDGRLLVVGARAAWNDGDPERNASVFDTDGVLTATACVGDGVAHVRTTASGSIWTAYFDEGVYGPGWGPDGVRDPIGGPGLLRWSSTFEIEWSFRGRGAAVIDDCYAFNVAGERAAAYYYMDFPIITVENDALHSWSTRVAGARSLVIGDNTAALIGGYPLDHDRLVTGRLGDAFEVKQQSRLTLPDGAPLPKDAVLVGTGDLLDVFVGRDWYRLGLDDMVSAGLDQRMR